VYGGDFIYKNLKKQWLGNRIEFAFGQTSDPVARFDHLATYGKRCVYYDITSGPCPWWLEEVINNGLKHWWWPEDPEPRPKRPRKRAVGGP